MALGKPCAVLSKERYDIDKIFSDIKGMDQIGHHGDEFELVKRLCHWIESNVEEVTQRLAPQRLLKIGQIVKAALERGIDYRFINKAIIDEIYYRDEIYLKIYISSDGKLKLWPLTDTNGWMMEI
jgi:hypothetical protein